MMAIAVTLQGQVSVSPVIVLSWDWHRQLVW